MKHKLLDTRYMATFAMLCGVLLVMGMTGIGFIPLPVIKATTMHIPVIIGAILLGPKAGLVLGTVFGLCSIWANTTTPGLLSFAFSPFMTTEGLLGVAKSLWIALGCRMLFGTMAGWLWMLFRKFFKQEYAALPLTAAVSTILHTILVMGSIYVLLTQQYAEAKNVAISAVFGLIMGTITASGIPEAIAAAILVTVIGKALLNMRTRIKKR
jgi:uncharacterized membrane protein